MQFLFGLGAFLLLGLCNVCLVWALFALFCSGPPQREDDGLVRATTVGGAIEFRVLLGVICVNKK